MNEAIRSHSSRLIQYTIIEVQFLKRFPFNKLINALSRSLSLDTLNMRLLGKGVSLITELGSLFNINSLAILETVETVAVAVKPKNVFTPNLSLNTCNKNVLVKLFYDLSFLYYLTNH